MGPSRRVGERKLAPAAEQPSLILRNGLAYSIILALSYQGSKRC